MGIQELYGVLGGDYAGTMSRLMKEDRIRKYLTKFIDAKDFEELLQNIASENWPEAFRNIHTIKGVALNLGLSKLAETASVLTESLRSGVPTGDTESMLSDVKAEYQRTIEILRENL